MKMSPLSIQIESASSNASRLRHPMVRFLAVTLLVAAGLSHLFAIGMSPLPNEARVMAMEYEDNLLVDYVPPAHNLLYSFSELEPEPLTTLQEVSNPFESGTEFGLADLHQYDGATDFQETLVALTYGL